MTLKMGRGQHRKYFPYAFTEQGVAMLSSVLRSRRAVQVNIEIMRAFVRMRQMLASNVELARRLGELEKRYDAQFKIVFQAIRELMEPPEKSRRPIGLAPSPVEGFSRGGSEAGLSSEATAPGGPGVKPLKPQRPPNTSPKQEFSPDYSRRLRLRS
jgi:hypothetical protein